MKVELKSAPLKVISIKHRTKAKLFKEVEVGDVLQLSVTMHDVGGASRGIYATMVKVTNITKGTSDNSKSQTEVSKTLDCFELEEVIN